MDFLETLRNYADAHPEGVQAVADELSVSRPTVQRWLNGENLPHEAVQKPCQKFMEGKLAELAEKKQS